jgi:hypothetical protein
VVAVRDRVAGDGICGAEVGDHLVARHSAQPKTCEASWEGETSLFVGLSQSRHLHGSLCTGRRTVGEWEPQARRQAETPHVR